MEKNELGQVCVKHFNSNGTGHQVNGHTYTWIPKYNVSLAWVEEADVPNLLSVMINACCGHTGHKFSLANANDVSIHDTGHAL